ncbi:Transthyretin-like family protein [Ostertagia ostertagi]
MRCYILIFYFSALPRCHSLLGFGTTQSVAVEGELQCKGYPATNVQVILFDRGLLFDTKMATTRTDPHGKFRLSGWKSEFSKIDPKIHIYHMCNHGGVRAVSYDNC